MTVANELRLQNYKLFDLFYLIHYNKYSIIKMSQLNYRSSFFIVQHTHTFSLTFIWNDDSNMNNEVLQFTEINYHMFHNLKLSLFEILLLFMKCVTDKSFKYLDLISKSVLLRYVLRKLSIDNHQHVDYNNFLSILS